MMDKRAGEELKYQEIESKTGSLIITGDTLIFIPDVENDGFLKIKNETVQFILFQLESRELSRAIIAFDKITPPSSGLLTSYRMHKIELFHFAYLLFDPTEHIKTPLHKRMTPEEIVAELGTIPRVNLPSIRLDDRIVKFYGWNVDDIIRIYRPDGIYYRTVVRPQKNH